MLAHGKAGFTMVEMMISIAISGFILASLYGVVMMQQRKLGTQQDVSVLQQNLRAGIHTLQRELRMAGYDPDSTGNYGFTSVGIDANGNSAVTFTAADFDSSGADENITYSIYDYPAGNPDGNFDLGRDNGGGLQLAAENVAALGLAYAIDADGDGALDDSPAGSGNLVWAIDSDNDGDLDANLDTNNDGLINNNDCPVPGSANCTIAGDAIAPEAALTTIRAARMWVLARTPQPEPDFNDSHIYVVGNRVMTPNDTFRRRLLEVTVQCRNMGL